MYLWMEGFDASIETFGGAGVVGYVDAGEVGFAEFLGGAAGGEEFDVFGVEVGAEFDDAGFVGDGD